MLREQEAVIRRALIILDAVIVIIAFFLAYLLRQNFHLFYNLDLIPSSYIIYQTTAPLSNYMIVLILNTFFWCFMLYINGMYLSLRIKTFIEILWIIIKSSFFTILASGTFVFLLKLEFVSRIFFVLLILTSFMLILIEKIIIFYTMHSIRKRGYNYRRIIIVGTGNRAAEFSKKIHNHPEWGIKILGVIDDEPGRGIKKVNGIDVIAPLKDISKVLHQHAVDEVVFIVPRLRLNYVENAVYACEIEGVKATLAVDLFDFKIARSRQTELDGIPLLTFDTSVAKEWQLFVKRTNEVILSGIGLILLMPFLIMVGILIKLTSPGPVLFKQIRVGLNGREFILYKFRTMFQGAEKKLSKVEQLNEMGGPIFKIKKDPRITPLGKILRKFSIDELPQLFNVFVGHMGLVGPRPPLPEEVEKYETWQRRRLSMRPGLTCLWQIQGRSKIDFEEWMKLDLKYLDNWSLWLDFKILIKTIPVVLFGIGAY